MVKISYGASDKDNSKTYQMYVFEYEWDRWDSSSSTRYSYADWHNFYLASMANDGTLSQYSSINFDFSVPFASSPKEDPFTFTRCYSVDQGGGTETDYATTDTTEIYQVNQFTQWTYITHPGVASFRDGFLRGLVHHDQNGTFDPSFDIRNYTIQNQSTWENTFDTEVYNKILAYKSELSAYSNTFTEYIDAIKAGDPTRFDVDDPSLVTYPISTLVEDDEIEFMSKYDITDTETIYCVLRFILKDSES